MTGKMLADPFVIDFIHKVNEKVHLANVELYHFWLQHMLFDWHWWGDLGLTVIPWVFWLRVRKKDSTSRLLFAVVTLMLITSYLDFLGIVMGLWGYPYKLVPTIPPFLTWDVTLLPVTAMLFYQFKPRTNKYIKAVCFAVLGSFIVQPVFQWLGFYDPMGWKHYYSFPFMVIIYLIGDYLTKRGNFELLQKSVQKSYPNRYKIIVGITLV